MGGMAGRFDHQPTVGGISELRIKQFRLSDVRIDLKQVTGPLDQDCVRVQPLDAHFFRGRYSSFPVDPPGSLLCGKIADHFSCRMELRSFQQTVNILLDSHAQRTAGKHKVQQPLFLERIKTDDAIIPKPVLNSNISAGYALIREEGTQLLRRAADLCEIQLVRAQD